MGRGKSVPILQVMVRDDGRGLGPFDLILPAVRWRLIAGYRWALSGAALDFSSPTTSPVKMMRDLALNCL